MGLGSVAALSCNYKINPIKTQKPSCCLVLLASTPTGRIAERFETLTISAYLGFLFRCYSDPEIGRDAANSRRAECADALGIPDPRGIQSGVRSSARVGSGLGRLRNRRASRITSPKSRRPHRSWMMSSRSPCSDVAMSVHFPAAPLPVSAPLMRTNNERPGVFRRSPTTQYRPLRMPF